MGYIVTMEKETKMKLEKHEIAGWIGMALLQGATMPVMLQRFLNPETATLPPLSMVLLVWAGLMMYLWRAIVQKDMLYIVSNSIGFALNSVLLALIVFPT